MVSGLRPHLTSAETAQEPIIIPDFSLAASVGDVVRADTALQECA
jgi:hypothetical protein